MPEDEQEGRGPVFSCIAGFGAAGQQLQLFNPGLASLVPPNAASKYFRLQTGNLAHGLRNLGKCFQRQMPTVGAHHRPRGGVNLHQ